MNIIEVPATITQEMADCVGCTPEQYFRIVSVARLFVPKRQAEIVSANNLKWPLGQPGHVPD